MIKLSHRRYDSEISEQQVVRNVVREEFSRSRLGGDPALDQVRKRQPSQAVLRDRVDFPVVWLRHAVIELHPGSSSEWQSDRIVSPEVN